MIKNTERLQVYSLRTYIQKGYRICNPLRLTRRTGQKKKDDSGGKAAFAGASHSELLSLSRLLPERACVAAQLHVPVCIAVRGCVLAAWHKLWYYAINYLLHLWDKADRMLLRHKLPARFSQLHLCPVFRSIGFS